MRRFFISYVSVDHAWALWVARELHESGSVVHLNEIEVDATEGLFWIRARVQAGDAVIILVSRAYLARHDIFGAEEIDRFTQGGLRDAVLYLCVDSMLFSPSEKRAHFCEISGIPESWARVRFKQFLAESRTAWPTTVPNEIIAALEVS
jgi:hypothetical protein